MGYHSAEIHKGETGEVTKITEEFEEFMDAVDQGNEVMSIVELSDLYGAIEMYLEKHHPSISMHDIKIMSRTTRSAFESGERA